MRLFTAGIQDAFSRATQRRDLPYQGFACRYIRRVQSAGHCGRAILFCCFQLNPHPPGRAMVSTRSSAGKHKYSILLPTYNERENIALIIWLIVKYLDRRCPFLSSTLFTRVVQSELTCTDQVLVRMQRNQLRGGRDR